MSRRTLADYEQEQDELRDRAAMADLRRRDQAEIAALREEIEIRKDAHHKLTIINWDLRAELAETKKTLAEVMPSEEERGAIDACQSIARLDSRVGQDCANITKRWLSRLDAARKAVG